MGGVRAHGVCQEGWERDFPPTEESSLPMGCVKKGGKGSSCPRGECAPMGCVKKGGSGDGWSGDGWSRERAHRVSEHKREFPPTGGVRAHGVCQEGWERDFPPTEGVPAHGLCQEGWEREFPPTGGVLAHGLLKKKPQPLWNGWGFF